ncbi:MFS transporter [Microbacterium aurum]|uniref:Putative proline/betaine transporter n=1 Tax=Microbacterium aurum TaxID=36805 RepID=A0A1P8U736_9MICO|nr:MFS transporter [Microbacterium aurum]
MKAALASLLGSTLEYYDFFIYGAAAALVFNHLFFTDVDPAVGLIASFATFGVGYIARPLGGLVIGHFGDRLGRKRALLTCLLLMGASSFLIGCLPTYEAVGIWAPIMLTVLRLAQGFSAGAESAGASTLTVEHSPTNRRGFFSSFLSVGIASGSVLATVVFIPVAALPDEALYSWGWRVPFWISVVVVAVAYFVRTRLEETPVFQEIAEEDEVRNLPIKDVVRYQFPSVIRVMGATTMGVMQSLVTVFVLAYATQNVGVDRPAMLTIIAVATGLMTIVVPLAGRLSDRVGRRPVTFIAVVGCGLGIFPYLWIVSTGNAIAIAVATVVFLSLFYSCREGVWPAFYAEQFAAPVRYSGMALGNQLGNLIAGFAPLIAASLVVIGGWVPVAVFGAGVAVIAGTAVYFMRETSSLTPQRLDEPYETARANHTGRAATNSLTK